MAWGRGGSRVVTRSGRQKKGSGKRETKKRTRATKALLQFRNRWAGEMQRCVCAGSGGVRRAGHRMLDSRTEGASGGMWKSTRGLELHWAAMRLRGGEDCSPLQCFKRQIQGLLAMIWKPGRMGSLGTAIGAAVALRHSKRSPKLHSRRLTANLPTGTGCAIRRPQPLRNHAAVVESSCTAPSSNRKADSISLRNPST